tara:strand:+ start:2497 stop:5424 length:2928 start_codon:yes stop_codon:yes gene_type:complete
MAEQIILSPEQINATPFLKESKALPGDKVVDGEFIRVFSKERDVEKGIVISQENINATPFLQQEKANVGDRIIDGELVRTKEPTTLQNLDYGYEELEGPVFALGNYLESILPLTPYLGRLGFDFSRSPGTLGFTYDAPGETYGPDFKDASPEERRNIIFGERIKRLKEEFPAGFEPDKDSLAYQTGSVAGAVIDPGSLIPVGQTYKKVAAVSGGLGLVTSLLEDLNRNKPIDKTKAALYTGGGAIIGPAAKFGIDKIVQKSASKVVNNMNNRMDELNKLGNGVTQEDIPKIATELGYTEKQVQRAYQVMGQKPYARTVDLSKTNADHAVTEDSAVSRFHSETLDEYLGILSTQIRNISIPIFGKLRKFESNVAVKTQNALLEIEDFAENLHKTLDDRSLRDVALHLSNGRFDEVSNILKNNAKEITVDVTLTGNSRVINISDSFNKVIPVLKNLGEELEGVYKINPNKIKNYFPRSVNDIDGLTNALGSERRGFYEQQLEAYAKSKNITPTNIKPEIKNEILNNAVRGYKVDVTGNTPRFIKGRTIDNVTDDLLQFYDTPAESLQKYVRSAINNIERSKFFGKGFDIDTEDSIGAWIKKELPDINNADQTKLQSLLEARFVKGEQSVSQWSRAFKDVGYAGTIANPIAAVTQVGDLGLSGFKNGLKPTLKAAMPEVFNLSGPKVRLVDLGLDNVISTEMGNPSKFANGLSKLFKASGFRSVDKFGKETYINAALIKNKKLVKSEKGIKKLKEKWGKVFGNDTEPLIADLQAGKMSENVKLLLFNELSDVQPISLSEMPPKYLESKDGRVFYMLKSFGLKQIDVVRRDIIQEASKKGMGHKIKAVKDMTKLAAYLSGANLGTQTVKDLILGKDVRIDDIPENLVWSFLGVYGLTKYGTEKLISDGKILEAGLRNISPANPLLESVGKIASELVQEETDYEKIQKQVKNVPIAGTIMYHWFLGGAEKYNEKLSDKDF